MYSLMLLLLGCYFGVKLHIYNIKCMINSRYFSEIMNIKGKIAAAAATATANIIVDNVLLYSYT